MAQKILLDTKLRPQSSGDKAELSGGEPTVGTVRAATAPGTGQSLPDPLCPPTPLPLLRDKGQGGRRLGMQAGCCCGVLPFPPVPLFPLRRSPAAEAGGSKQDGGRPSLHARAPPPPP